MNYKILYIYITLVVAVVILSIFIYVSPRKYKNTIYELSNYLSINEINLKNGSKGFLSYNENSEVIALSIIFKGGTFLEPLNKKGITNILTNMLTSSYNDEIKKTLKKYSIKFNTAFGIDNITFNILVTKDNLDNMFKVLKLILEHTNFDNNDLKVIKNDALLNIKLSEHYTKIQGSREFYKAIFNGDARFLNSMGTEKTIRTITIKDLVEVRKKLMTQNNIVIGVSGNIDINNLTNNLNNVFASLLFGKPINIDNNYVTINNNFINIPVSHSTNSDIFIALRMPQNYEKENMFATEIINDLLGSGVNSLLVEEVRVKRGLAYTISSNLVNTLYGNFWVIRATTENSKAKETIEIIKNVLADLRMKKYTRIDISKVKKYMLNSYLLEFNNSIDIANALAEAAFLGKSKSDLFNRNAYIQQVKIGEIDNIVNTYINPNDLLIVLSGTKV